MNRKQRRAQASIARSNNTVEDKKKELVERYSRLAATAGNLNYQVYVLNKEMEDIQRQHAALLSEEEKAAAANPEEKGEADAVQEVATPAAAANAG